MLPRFELKVFSERNWEGKNKMEDFLAAVRSLCADKNYNQLAEYLNRSSDLLQKHAGQLDAAIASLDPEQHSMAFMALM